MLHTKGSSFDLQVRQILTSTVNNDHGWMTHDHGRVSNNDHGRCYVSVEGSFLRQRGNFFVSFLGRRDEASRTERLCNQPAKRLATDVVSCRISSICCGFAPLLKVKPALMCLNCGRVAATVTARGLGCVISTNTAPISFSNGGKGGMKQSLSME